MTYIEPTRLMAASSPHRSARTLEPEAHPPAWWERHDTIGSIPSTKVPSGIATQCVARRPSKVDGHQLGTREWLSSVSAVKAPFGSGDQPGPTLLCRPESFAVYARPHTYILSARNRSALPITDTDDRLMAAAAIIGDNSTPKTG